jgi:hypothetical protein
MKLVLSSLLACFFFLSVSYSQTKAPGLPTPRAELLNLIRIWNEAELRGDAVKVAQLLAPEFSFCGWQYQRAISQFDEAGLVFGYRVSRCR